MSNTAITENILLAPVNRKIDGAFSGKKALALKLFARQFFASTSKADLRQIPEAELYRQILEAWKFIAERKRGAPKIAFIQQDVKLGEERKPITSIYFLLDDMPFIVESIRQGLNRAGVTVKRVNNAVIYARRTAAKSLSPGAAKSKARAAAESEVLQDLAGGTQAGYQAEAICRINCLHFDASRCQAIEAEIVETLQHVTAAVTDYPAMCKRALDIRDSLREKAGQIPLPAVEIDESLEFIAWLVDNHFTFLGYEEYRIKRSKQERYVELQQGSMLGVARFKTSLKARANISSLHPGTGDLILKKKICGFAKSGIRSRVHRHVYQDYVLLREFDKNGKVAIEHRFIGLYSSAVYYQAALEIPLVRKKVTRVLERSGFAPNGHSIKELLQVINVFPRDELFQISHKQLASTAIEIAKIQETRTSRLFIRRDSYGKFFSCLVYVPRDIFNTSVRLRIQDFLKQRLQAEEIDFNTNMSESILVRVHFTLRVPAIHLVNYQLPEIERELIALVKPWEDYFQEALLARYSEQQATEYYDWYASCFSSSYKESYGAQAAADDVEHIERVVRTNELSLKLASCSAEAGAELSFKIFSHKHQLFLSDVDPILENLGLNIVSEKSFRLQPNTDYPVWLHEFSLYHKHSDEEASANLRQNFEEAFRAVWSGRINDDTFNALVTNADVSWRDAALLRAYAVYLKQIQFGYGIGFIAETLSRHQHVSRLLIEYFHALFDPLAQHGASAGSKIVREKIALAIDAVVNLSEDSVLRAFLNLMDSTLRTNFFQKDAAGQPKDYFSFKFNAEQIDGVPLPRPKFEIFVFSRQMEGVHLRAGKVARGGLRWSDRTEDYRTEVLGLVKAQQVKNSVIVPVGAKGGFVIKGATAGMPRDEFMALGVRCYQTFVSGLLDITDNLRGTEVVPPPSVIRRDADDPYLVVAADKGTATFSDIANRISAEYGFWLGDGFASGGSNGYDHKAMGITAKGAWISVQRHFRELNINVQQQDFTVVGIGDMSGDVFGNGMLLSPHICLVAAFNHMHIFIDPDPASALSMKERERLFRLPRSTWADYDQKLISRGGGVFERSAKIVKISLEMKRRFAITADALTPNELIRHLLRSEADLLWNGGIGTYVKATAESHADVGDKTNDALRVNGSELRCKVIGEGGNLGMTQAARIEYGKRGGISLTDFIDNSAGVDCSDHEVNIKIVLNKLLANNTLTIARRNKLLGSMTDEIAALVLADNYNQVQAIGIAKSQMELRNKEFAGLVNYLEAHAGLNRKLENLPDNDQLEERYAKGQYLTRPEIAIITSYMKMFLKARLVTAPYLEDPFLHNYLFGAFPRKLVKTYKDEVLRHPLRKEIIATQLANSVVNLVGPSFVYRMADSTGSTVAEVVKTAVIVKKMFQIQTLWEAIEALDYKVAAAVQIDMMSRLIRLIRRATRWLLRNRRKDLGFSAEIDFFASMLNETRAMLPGRLPPDFAAMFADKLAYLQASQVPMQLAQRVTESEFLYPAISFIEISTGTKVKLGRVVDTYYAIGEELQLNWLGKMINQLGVSGYWQAMARESYLDDLSRQQQALTCNVVSQHKGNVDAEVVVAQWAAQNAGAVARVKQMLKQLQTEVQPEYSMFSVVLRELQTLSRITGADA